MEFIHVMSEKLCIRISTSENIVRYNVNMVFREFSGPLKFIYANQLLSVILWKFIEYKYLCYISIFHSTPLIQRNVCSNLSILGYIKDFPCGI